MSVIMFMLPANKRKPSRTVIVEVMTIYTRAYSSLGEVFSNKRVGQRQFIDYDCITLCLL